MTGGLKRLYGALAFVAVLTFVKVQITRPPSPVPIPITSYASSSLQQEEDVSALAAKLRESVTFLPLKDVRFSDNPMRGHTWFMSSLNDTMEEGESQYQKFPSHASKGRVLCLKGRDTRDGTRNSYALAWPRYLPVEAVRMRGNTYVSNNQYIYDNIWHGLSALIPFVGWFIRNDCRPPDRWVLFHKGELRTGVIPWLRMLMEATFDGHFLLEDFEGVYGNETNDASVCFEEAVVMRHNEGLVTKEKRRRIYDLMRCKARMYCNLGTSSKDEGFRIGMTLLMRDGPRSFRNSSAVISIFRTACRRVEGCQLKVAYISNLTFCEQVDLMRATDVLVTAHGAQLTNMFLMDRNSSVMELFPKGWLEHAGIGQYIYHWEADWAGMIHRGAWRDPVADDCADSKDLKYCDMRSFKDRKIGHDDEYFLEWAGKVLDDARRRKSEDMNGTAAAAPGVSGLCGCKP